MFKKYLPSISLIFFGFFSTAVAQPAIWSVNSRADFVKGDWQNTSLDVDGSIKLAPKLSEIYKTGQQFIWSSVVDSRGVVYLGTGGDGKIFKVDADGRGSQFADLAEMNVSALALGRDGELYAGTSPDGRVYRIDQNGKVETYFQPNEKYIWSMVSMADGLAVATGTGGRIFKVRSANATPASSLLFDTSETHVISLAVDRQGSLYAGTDANGLVMRFGSDGKPFGLLDSPLREIHSLVVGSDGSVYALALGEAAAVKPGETASSATPTPESRTVTATRPDATPEPPARSRYDLTNAKTAVYRILPNGGNDLLWSSTAVTGFSLLAREDGSGALLGTSDRGRIYGITNDGRETILSETEASQISTLFNLRSGLMATSNNQGSLYRVGPDTAAEGSYSSPILDTRSTGTWGRLWWQSSGNVALQTRTGNTTIPDETWSEWSPSLSDKSASTPTSLRARYFQWRATLKTGASLSEVNLAFTSKNIAPEVLSVTILPTNVGLAANPPPPVDPNIELSGLSPSVFGVVTTSPPPRRVYQRSATSLQWTASDRNGDRMVYDVHYKKLGEANFTPLRIDLTDTFLTVDGQSLADGRYVFRITAKDTPTNPVSLALTGERLSDPIEIDNTPPVVTIVAQPTTNGDKTRIVFTATDTASYIVLGEYSVNGGGWLPVNPDDGIADSPSEKFTVEVPIQTGEIAVILRAFDVNRNAGNARQVVARR